MRFLINPIPDTKKWNWTLVSSNGTTVARSSRNFATKKNAKESAESVNNQLGGLGKVVMD